MEKEIKLNVSWNKFIKISTLLISIVLIIIPINVVFYSSNFGIALTITVFAIIIATIIYVLSMAPLYIVVENDRLILKKIFGKTVWKYDDVANIEIYDSSLIKNVRVFGSGGFCGFLGRYYNSKIGSYQSYVGDYNQTIYIKMKNNKQYMLSCENRDLVVSFIKEKIK